MCALIWGVAYVTSGAGYIINLTDQQILEAQNPAYREVMEHFSVMGQLSDRGYIAEDGLVLFKIGEAWHGAGNRFEPVVSVPVVHSIAPYLLIVVVPFFVLAGLFGRNEESASQSPSVDDTQ